MNKEFLKGDISEVWAPFAPTTLSQQWLGHLENRFWTWTGRLDPLQCCDPTGKNNFNLNLKNYEVDGPWASCKKVSFSISLLTYGYGKAAVFSAVRSL